MKQCKFCNTKIPESCECFCDAKKIDDRLSKIEKSIQNSSLDYGALCNDYKDLRGQVLTLHKNSGSQYIFNIVFIVLMTLGLLYLNYRIGEL